MDHGDMEVLIDPCLGTGTLHAIDDVDVDTDETGLIIWAGEAWE